MIIIRQGKTREELEEALIEPTLSVKRSRVKTQKVKDNLLAKNKIIGGNVQIWINNPRKELPNLDWQILCLFAEQVYNETENKNINPEDYYTEVELKRASQFMGNILVKEDISLPLKLENVMKVNDQFMTKIDVKTLAQMSSFLLNYNFDIQREAKRIVKRSGETIREATLNMKNVEEIRDNLKNGKQEITNIVINAGAGTSDEGNELDYNPLDNTLIINEGTILDIVDGYHRCRASELVINENPDIEFEFMLLILNYTDEMAMNYQGQFAKQMPLTSTRQKQLSKPRHADEIVDKLSKQSELRGKIATSKVPSLKGKELVSYEVLTNIIDKEFKLDRVIDVINVTKYLRNFFNILIETHPKQFLQNPLEWKKKSVMVENNMFIGYIVLARKMYENNISEDELIIYMNKIDFDRDNKLWREIGFLNADKKLNDTYEARKAIRNYFNNLDI